MPKIKHLNLVFLLTLSGLSQNAFAVEPPYKETIAVSERTPITLHIFLPANSPKGVLIALHGCGGLLSISDKNGDRLSSRHSGMAQFANERGWVAVFPDSFTARGRREICTQKFSERTIGQATRKADALATLHWIKTQPWAKIAENHLNTVLLGWSNGGSTVLQTIETEKPSATASSLEYHPSTKKSVSSITSLVAQAVAFYPGCSSQLARNFQTQIPLILFLGGKDDWTAPGPCVALGERVNARVYVYPEAHHSFDSPGGKLRHRPEVPNGVNPGQGVHTGPHEASRDDAYAKLGQLLDTLSNK